MGYCSTQLDAPRRPATRVRFLLGEERRPVQASTDRVGCVHTGMSHRGWWGSRDRDTRGEAYNAMRQPNTRGKTQRRSGGRRLFALLAIVALSGVLTGSTVITGGVSLAGAAAAEAGSAASKYQAPTVAPGDWP